MTKFEHALCFIPVLGWIPIVRYLMFHPVMLDDDLELMLFYLGCVQCIYMVVLWDCLIKYL